MYPLLTGACGRERELVQRERGRRRTRAARMIFGHFIDPSEGVRSTKDVEVKWGIHPVGDKRPEWTADDQRTTLVLLVHGSFRIDLTETSVTLQKQGDYAAWGPGIDHSWEAITEAVVITVRWPSSPA